MANQERVPERVSATPWLEPDAEPFVKIRGVSKTFGDFVAVDNVDLDIYKGELFCLLGGSGCGKSTLLRMLAGFERPTSGTISIDGTDMSTVPAYERPTNMMFQSYALFPHMTVEKNIAYGLKQGNVARAEIAERVDDVLRLVQLQDFSKRKPSSSRAGRCNAWPWPGRWSSARSCSCSTSRWARSTSGCASRRSSS